MGLPIWWQVAKPHEDIVKERLSEAVFAADLGDVVLGRAPMEYSDAVTFFQKTYITQGLKNLIKNVVARLNGEGWDPVIQLQTPFGGGKTHSLLALYHIVKNWERVKHLNVFSNVSMPKKAKVAVFVGTQADALRGRTPWGEIAYQLGTYDKVKEHDVKRRSPGKDVLLEILGNGPVLLLMDEIVEYMVKAKDFAEQISAFSHELTEAVSSKENCCLVCTLPSSAPYGEEGERALNELQKIFGRLEAVYTPVEGVEIYEVIRKRLFDNIGSEKIRKEVAHSYFEMYQKLGGDVPSEVKEVEYRERMELAYPFHPELIDVLYERWGSFPGFQRTRGVLRLLANVVADLYKRKVVSPLIQSSLVNLEEQSIRREFLKHIGNEYESVITSDIAGPQAKAKKIDKEIGNEYETYGIATGIATSIFLYSFSGGEKREVNLPHIRVATLREGIPPTMIGDAVNKLEDELWYLHSERKIYSFRNQPNINRIILDREESIPKGKVLEQLKTLIEKNAGRAMEVYLWPEKSSDIPDTKSIKLAILGPEYTFNSETGKKLATELYERAGSSFRVYKNTLFILATDESQATQLQRHIRQYMALDMINKDSRLLNNLTKESQAELKKKLKEKEGEIDFKIRVAYRYLALMETTGVEWKDLGMPTVGMNFELSKRAKDYLKELEKIIGRVTPRYVIEKTFSKDEQEKVARDIYELSLKTPGMPIFEDEAVLVEALREGVEKGLFGIKEGAAVYFKEKVSPTIDSIIVRGGEFINLKQANEEAKEKKKIEVSVKEEKKETPQIVKEQPTVKKITLTARVPWDKISQLFSGVLAPIKEKSENPEIIIRISSEGSFDRSTLDLKVKETLMQIGAEIKEWVEE